MTAPQPSDAGIFAQIRADARRNVARTAPQGFTSPAVAAEIGNLIGPLDTSEQAAEPPSAA